MSTTQIRFTANESMISALGELRHKFKFLSDGEILKIAFSQFYNKEMGYDENGFSPAFQKELDGAIEDIENGENLEGPFDSVEEFFDSMK